jgi:hypothetical protein
MVGPNQYRLLADTCLQKAISAHSASLAEAWLQMAASWIAVAKFQQQIRHARNFLKYGLPTTDAIRVRVPGRPQ